MFDKRGTGLSDRVSTVPTLEERADDIRAVIEAVGCDLAAVAGTGDGAAIATMFAATYPERVSHLILSMCVAKATRDESQPWGFDPGTIDALSEMVQSSWGTGRLASILAPSMADDERFLAWFRRFEPRVRHTERRRRDVALELQPRRAVDPADDPGSDLVPAPPRCHPHRRPRGRVGWPSRSRARATSSCPAWTSS